MHGKIVEIRVQQDRQMQEVCAMIEELAKVVKSFEGQVAQVKEVVSNEVRREVSEVEKRVGKGIEEVRAKGEEQNRAVATEIAMIKRRHSRLISLYTTGLESNLQEGMQ